MIIGVFTGIVFNFDPRLSLLAGYAGTDILEGIYKSFKTEKVMVVPSKKWKITKTWVVKKPKILKHKIYKCTYQKYIRSVQDGKKSIGYRW